jgi:hypothetical protein
VSVKIPRFHAGSAGQYGIPCKTPLRKPMKTPDLKTELATLKSENKKLKALLKNAVLLLNKYKPFLQHPEKLGGTKKQSVAKKKKKPAG